MARALEIRTLWGDTVLDTVHADALPSIPEALLAPLERGEAIAVRDGAVVTEIRWARQVEPPRGERKVDHLWANVLIVAAFAHAAVLGVFVSSPAAPDELAGGVRAVSSRWATVQLTPAPPRPRREESALAGLREQASKLREAGAQRAPARETHPPRAKGGGGTSVVDALFPGDGGAVFGPGLGADLAQALDGVVARPVAASEGLGGSRSPGGGPGGLGGLGGLGGGRDIGPLRTPGRGDGDRRYGDGVGALERKKEREPEVGFSSPRVLPALDKQLIRGVISDHLQQVRYCYERALVRNPGLFGKVSAAWTIGPDGRVRDATIESSTLPSPEVGRCVEETIRSWSFPSPRGGGSVVVRYPFVFTTTG